MDQISSMDVRFYPAAAGSALPGDPSNLDFAQCLGYYNYNKVIIPRVLIPRAAAGPAARGPELGLCRGGEARGWGCRSRSRGGCARRAPRGRGMLGPGKLRSAGPGGSSAPGNLPSGRCPGSSERCEQQTAGRSSGSRSCSPWPANKGASRARSVGGGVGTCRTFPGPEPRRLPALRTEPGGLGRPREERTEPPSDLFSWLSQALLWPGPNQRIIQTGGLSKSASAAGTGG